MHNLLPEENKKKILDEYHLRLAVTASFLLFALGIILSISFLPALILAISKEKSILSEQEILSKSIQSLESENLIALLGETKEKVDSLNGLSSTESLSYIIEKALSKKGTRISIMSFTFDPEKDNMREFTIEGIADTRDELVKFKKELESEKLFSMVSLPISDLARQANLPFTLRLSVKGN